MNEPHYESHMSESYPSHLFDGPVAPSKSRILDEDDMARAMMATEMILPSKESESESESEVEDKVSRSTPLPSFGVHKQIDRAIDKIGLILAKTDMDQAGIEALLDLIRMIFDSGYELGHKDGEHHQMRRDDLYMGRSMGQAVKARPEVEAAAVELSDLVIQMEGAPARALALAATISGLMNTSSGAPVESSSIVHAKDLQEGAIYVAHRGSETFTWEYVGPMPDGERMRIRRKGEKITVEKLSDHGLVGGGPRGSWTEFTGITRNGLEHVADEADGDIPEGETDVLGS